MLGKKLGKRAMLLGALAQSIPDIDFVAVLWNDTASNLLAHRGFTHSLVFDVLITGVMSLLAERLHKSHRVGYKQWLIFFAIQVTLHLLIDILNNYGVGILEPFNHVRISFNTLYVADPFFSIWPAISFVALLIHKPRVRQRIFWCRFAIFFAGIYLVYCGINKLDVRHDVKQTLDKQNVVYNDYITTPTPLNNWLWYVVASTDSGYFVGYRSVFDKGKIDLTYFPRNHNLLYSVDDHEEVQKLIRFSKGYYTVEQWSDTLVFNDLRFGQIIGWHDPRERFAFHYYLGHSEDDNRLVVQRGRFARWDEESFRSLIRKIKGD